MSKKTIENDDPLSSAVQPLTWALAEELFWDRNGRVYGRKPALYPLPADSEETSRLDNEHVWLKMLRDGKNYPSVVPDALACQPGEVKHILDLGCGTGTWVHEMAEEFPSCDLIGVDLLPIQPHPQLSSYCFEVDDINLGLEHFYDQFNMVNARFISIGVRDYRSLILEAAKVLLPGGHIVLQEFEYTVYDKDRDIVPAYGARLIWFSRWAHLLATARNRMLGDIEVSVGMRNWLEQQQDELWENIGGEELWVPIGMWHQDPTTQDERRTNTIGEMVRADCIALLPATRDFLINHSGYDVSYIDSTIDNTTAELTSDEGSLKIQFRIHCAWATKVGPR